MLHDHLVADAVLHLLLAPALGDHQVILGDLLPHLPALNLAAPILQDLLLEQRVALSGMQAVSLGLLRGLLLLEGHQEVAFVLVARLESFLLNRGPEEGRAAVVMNLHHLLLLHLDLLLLFLVLALLQHKHIRFPRGGKNPGGRLLTTLVMFLSCTRGFTPRWSMVCLLNRPAPWDGLVIMDVLALSCAFC